MTPAVLVRDATRDTLRTVFEVTDGFAIDGVAADYHAPVAVIVWRDDAWWLVPRDMLFVDDIAITSAVRLRHGSSITEGELRGWRLRFLVGDRERALGELRHIDLIRDPLTGVFNRTIAFQALARMTSGVVMLGDIDWLKRINDQHGMLAGDATVKRTARIFKAHVAWPNVLARYGGEELVVAMPGATLPEARQLAERIRAACEPSFDYEGIVLTATVSIGLAVHNSGNLGLHAADDAVAQAKSAGRNRVHG